MYLLLLNSQFLEPLLLAKCHLASGKLQLNHPEVLGLNQTDQYGSAFIHFQVALQLYQQLNRPDDCYDCFSQMSLCKEGLGDLHQAVQCLREALMFVMDAATRNLVLTRIRDIEETLAQINI